MKIQKRILYIHGFDGSPAGNTALAVKAYYKDAAFIAEPFDLLDYDGTLNKIRAIKKDERITMIVAHSFGAYFALSLHGDYLFTVVMNPCMLPTETIPRLYEENGHGVLSADTIAMMKAHEEATYKQISPLVAQHTFGVFGTHDELFSYKDLFAKHYGTTVGGNVNYTSIDSGHKVSAEGIAYALPLAEKFFGF